MALQRPLLGSLTGFVKLGVYRYLRLLNPVLMYSPLDVLDVLDVRCWGHAPRCPCGQEPLNVTLTLRVQLPKCNGSRSS